MHNKVIRIPRSTTMPAVCLVLCLVLSSSAVFAAGSIVPYLPVRPGIGVNHPHVTVLILDMSESMARNDPGGLRCSAAEAYIDLSGPGDWIGVVGLSDAGGQTGAYSFNAAETWSHPVEMATVQARNSLKLLIQQRSDHCHAGGNTPTYDALQQAAQMLASSTDHGRLPGSVILLTDGQPNPNTAEQLASIQHDLLPQYQRHRWKIFTVALGPDEDVQEGSRASTFHQLLRHLSEATSATHYDDSHGIIRGTTPLNLAPFFVDIFRSLTGRLLGPSLGPSSLAGAQVVRNLTVAPYTRHLDVMILKSAASLGATVSSPGSEVLISPFIPGVRIATDPYYIMYSIDQPVTGNWQLIVRGRGTFLVQSLKQSGLSLLITLRPAGLYGDNQLLKITAQLIGDGALISGPYELRGVLQPVRNGQRPKVPIHFQFGKPSAPGMYQITESIPLDELPGSYEVQVSASLVSNALPVAKATRSISLGRVPPPLPYFFVPGTRRVTGNPIRLVARHWDPVIHALYSLPFGFVPSLLRDWALSGRPVDSPVIAAGQVQRRGKPFKQSSVRAVSIGRTNRSDWTITNEGAGRFRVVLFRPSTGSYGVVLEAVGSSGRHPVLGRVRRSVVVNDAAVGVGAEITAWTRTCLYLLVYFMSCLCAVALVRFLLSWRLVAWYIPADGKVTDEGYRIPGEQRGVGRKDAEVGGGGGQKTSERTSKGRDAWARSWIQPSIVSGKSDGEFGGLEVLVTRRGRRAGLYGARVCHGYEGYWEDYDGRELAEVFRPVMGVRRVDRGRRNGQTIDEFLFLPAAKDARKAVIERYQDVKRRPRKARAISNRRAGDPSNPNGAMPPSPFGEPSSGIDTEVGADGQTGRELGGGQTG